LRRASTSIDAACPAYDAVIVAVPTPTAVSTPACAVTTSGADELQVADVVTSSVVPFARFWRRET
jgi:hypothetical protein